MSIEESYVLVKQHMTLYEVIVWDAIAALGTILAIVGVCGMLLSVGDIMEQTQ